MTRNLVIYKGADFGPLTILVEDANGDPVNLAGFSVYAQARKKPSAELAFDLAPTISDAGAGEIQIYPRAADTADWTDGNFIWDLILENGDGDRIAYLAQSRVTVRGMATQPA